VAHDLREHSHRESSSNNILHRPGRNFSFWTELK